MSGILLGKTMGRAPELADRFERRVGASWPTSRCARGWPAAGAWRRVQMTFAIMPALVYWFAGQSIASGGAAITIGTLVAFTTLQTRLLFPILSLLSVGIEIQTSLALFHRIFEYLDLPVDIAERGGAGRPRPGDGARRRALRGRAPSATTPTAPADARRHRPRRPGRHDGRRRGGDRGRARRRSATSSRACTTSTAGRVTIDGVDVRDLTFAVAGARRSGSSRRRPTCSTPRSRENLRFARPEATDEELETAARAAQIHDLIAVAARRLRHRRRRARLPLLRRREAAHRDRPHDPAQPAGARPRRGHERARHRDRARRAGRARRASPRAARRSRSRTGCRPCATPTRSSCSTAGGSPSAAPTTSCSRAAAATPRSSAAPRRSSRRSRDSAPSLDGGSRCPGTDRSR